MRHFINTNVPDLSDSTTMSWTLYKSFLTDRASVYFNHCTRTQLGINIRSKTIADKLGHLHDDVDALEQMIYLLYNICQDGNQLFMSTMSITIICDICKQFTDPCFAECVDIDNFIIAYMKFVSNQNPTASCNIPFASAPGVRLHLNPADITFLSFVEGITGNPININTLRWYLNAWSDTSSRTQKIPDTLCSRCFYMCPTIAGKDELRFMQVGSPCDSCMRRYLRLEVEPVSNMSGCWEQAADSSTQCTIGVVLAALPVELSDVQVDMVGQLVSNRQQQLRQFEGMVYTHGPFDAPGVWYVYVRSKQKHQDGDRWKVKSKESVRAFLRSCHFSALITAPPGSGKTRTALVFMFALYKLYDKYPFGFKGSGGELYPDRAISPGNILVNGCGVGVHCTPVQTFKQFILVAVPNDIIAEQWRVEACAAGIPSGLVIVPKSNVEVDRYLGARLVPSSYPAVVVIVAYRRFSRMRIYQIQESIFLGLIIDEVHLIAPITTHTVLYKECIRQLIALNRLNITATPGTTHAMKYGIKRLSCRGVCGSALQIEDCVVPEIKPAPHLARRNKRAIDHCDVICTLSEVEVSTFEAVDGVFSLCAIPDMLTLYANASTADRRWISRKLTKVYQLMVVLNQGGSLYTSTIVTALRHLMDTTKSSTDDIYFHFGIAIAPPITNIHDTCCICQSPISSPVQLQCRHVTCHVCIHAWFLLHAQDPTCPYCRSPHLNSMCRGEPYRADKCKWEKPNWSTSSAVIPMDVSPFANSDDTKYFDIDNATSRVLFDVHVTTESDSGRALLTAKNQVTRRLLLEAKENNMRTVISVGSRNGLSSIVMLLGELGIPYVTGCEYTNTNSGRLPRTKNHSHTTRGRISGDALMQFTHDSKIKVLILPIGIYDGINIPADIMIALQRAYTDEHTQVTGRIDRLGNRTDVDITSRKVYVLIHDHWFDKSLNIWQQSWSQQPCDTRGFFMYTYINRHNKNPLAMDGLLTRIGKLICKLVDNPIHDWSVQAYTQRGGGANQVYHFTLDINVMPTLSGVIHVVFDTKNSPVHAKVMYYNSVKWCSHEIPDTEVDSFQSYPHFVRMQTVLSAYLPATSFKQK
jgi:hypothetical protein